MARRPVQMSLNNQLFYVFMSSRRLIIHFFLTLVTSIAVDKDRPFVEMSSQRYFPKKKGEVDSEPPRLLPLNLRQTHMVSFLSISRLRPSMVKSASSLWAWVSLAVVCWSRESPPLTPPANLNSPPNYFTHHCLPSVHPLVRLFLALGVNTLQF